MRVALAVFLFAVACLTASTVAWSDGASEFSASEEVANPDLVLADFEATHHAVVIDVAALYSGRLDLLDPRVALPTWHEHARDEAVRVHVASARCPAPPLDGLTDVSLAKAYAWHRESCGDAEKIDVDGPPFVHPSGTSYAALALGRRAESVAWVRAHVRAFHVLELASLDPAALGVADRALAALSVRAWSSLARGDATVLSDGSLVVAAHGPFGLGAVRIYDRAEWETFAQRRGIALEPRLSTTLCTRPASSDLCWKLLSSAERHRSARLVATAASATLTVLASVAVAVAFVRERRRAHHDRIHVLHTLTHELRSPATTLVLDIEPLRAAYDDLPSSCQEPLLRISDGIERLQRVVHRSASYMALFETTRAPRLVEASEIPSARELFEELADAWPEDVMRIAGSEDGRLSTDREWLGIAIKNLVENAVRHGVAPVVVTWSLDEKSLVVRVEDRGETPKFELDRAMAPFGRGRRSSGLGLGLAIVSRIAHLLGGRLRHESSPTVFELRVPRGVR